MEQSIKLLVNAITVIQQIVKDNKKDDSDKNIVRANDGTELTEEEIKVLL